MREPTAAESGVNYLSLHADVRALTLLVDWLLLREAMSRPDPAAVVDEIAEAVRPGVESWSLPGAPPEVQQRLRARLQSRISDAIGRLPPTSI